MRRSFNLPRDFSVSVQSLKEPKVLVRAALSFLLGLNLVAAAFAFHVFGSSVEELNRQLDSARAQMQAEQAKLNRSSVLASKMDTGRSEGEKFLATYMTRRRHTYSTIIGEITEMAKNAGMKMKEGTIAPLEPIEGSNDLDMMTVSVNFEGSYAQLVKFVNLLDRSPKFLIIESMQAAPQPKGDVLNVNIKLNTFVKDETGGVA